METHSRSHNATNYGEDDNCGELLLADGHRHSEEHQINHSEDLDTTETILEPVIFAKRKKIINRLISLKSVLLTSLKGWVLVESRKLIKLATPIFLALVLQHTQLIVSMLYVGHITGTSLELDAVGLAVSLLHVTARSVAIGLSTAVDTLSSQAYGFQNYRRVGIILQRGILILSVMMFPIWAIWLNSESILLILHQPPCVARLTALYMKLFCFSLPGWFVYVMVRQYLQAQGIVWAFVLVTLLSTVFSAIIHAVFIYGLKLDFLGGAIALSIANSTPAVLLILYTHLRGLHKKTWDGWSWESLNQWGQFLKLGLPGLLMTCIPWWSTEVTMFVSGYISKTELAVNSVGFQVLILLFMIPLGIGIAVGIRVGNELGAGNPTAAKRASYVALMMALCIATINTILLQMTKNYIGMVFTKDREVIQRVAMLMNLACIFQFSDEIQVTIGGILRGSGRQYLAAVINFFCYTTLGLPVGIALAFKTSLGTIGLWSGLAGGNIIQALAFFLVLLRTNWKRESEKAMKRSQDKHHAIVKGSSDALELESKIESDDTGTQVEAELNSNQEEQDENEDNSSLNSLIHNFDDSEVCHDIVTSRSVKVYFKKSRIKQLLCRGSFYIAGLAILVGGGVISRYHPITPLNYYDGNSTDCSENIFTSNNTFLES